MCKEPGVSSSQQVERLTTTHAKILSFSYSASSVAWNRFCSLWLLKCGYLPRQVGAMKSLSLVGKLVAQPVWAAFADAGNPAAVLVVSIILSTGTLECLRLGTRLDYEEHAAGGRHNWRVPFWWLWSLLGLSSSSKERSHQAAAVEATIQSAARPLVYWRVAALRVARSASSAASPVADAMVLALARDGGEAWGRQRFWGSASWGLGSVAVGVIIDKMGLEFGLFGVSHLMSVCLLIFLLVRVEPAWGAKQRRQRMLLKQGGTSASPTPTPDERGASQQLPPPPPVPGIDVGKTSPVVVPAMTLPSHDDEESVGSTLQQRDSHIHHRSNKFHMSVSMRNMQFSTSPTAEDGESSMFLGEIDTKQEPSATTEHSSSSSNNARDLDDGYETPPRKRDQKKNPTLNGGGIVDKCCGDDGTSSKKKKNVLRACGRGFGAVRQSAALRLALVNAMAFGTAVVAVDSILYMQLEAELQVSRTLSGLATAASTAATFPIFWHSAYIVKRYGYWTVLLLSQCILPARLILHAGINKSNVAYTLLPVQLLHGPMFAAWISAAVELVDRLAPADLRCSVQSLLTMTYFTVGGCLGHLLWATIFQLYGGRACYLSAAAVSTVTTLIFAIAARPHLIAESNAVKGRWGRMKKTGSFEVPAGGGVATALQV